MLEEKFECEPLVLWTPPEDEAGEETVEEAAGGDAGDGGGDGGGDGDDGDDGAVPPAAKKTKTGKEIRRNHFSLVMHR